MAVKFVVVFAVAVGGCGDGSGSGEPSDSDAGRTDGGGSPADAGESDATSSAGCTGLTQPELNAQISISSGGRDRVAAIHTPASYDTDVATPLVLNFHGYSSTANSQALLSKMIAKSDSVGFIEVHPTGVGLLNSWNGGACCGTAASQNLDDVQFASDLIDEIAKTHCVDPARIYATGFSNGGFLSHRLACELSERIAAIAPVSGVIGIDDCAPARPMPVMHFHGTADLTVPYTGNPLIDYISAQDVFDFWSNHNSCADSETSFDEGDSSCVSGTGCTAGGAITLCTISGAGHTWPNGTGIFGAAADIDATDAMWEFFTANPHPSP